MFTHAFWKLTFTSVTSESWGGQPDMEAVKRQIAQAAIVDSELSERPLGPYTPPKEIRELRLTEAAADQIRCMWHGHRQEGSIAPPTIPLRMFVTAFGQNEKGNTWADLEVHPGLDSWEVPARSGSGSQA